MRQWLRLAAGATALIAAAALAVEPAVAAGCGAKSATCTGEVAFPPSAYPSSGTLNVNVTATVASACTFGATAPGGSYAVNIVTGFSVPVNFTVTCNSNFRVGVVSANGALVLPGTPPGAGYSVSAPYNVDLHLVGDSSASADSGSCPATNLQTSGGSGTACNALRGPAVSGLQGLELTGKSTNDTSTITMSAPAYNGAGGVLVSSSNGYTDTLTVTIAAST